MLAPVRLVVIHGFRDNLLFHALIGPALHLRLRYGLLSDLLRYSLPVDFLFLPLHELSLDRPSSRCWRTHAI